MGKGVSFARFLAKAFLHLATEAIKLLPQRRNQGIQALAILLIDAAAAVFKDTVGKVFELGAQALFAVNQQALLLFCG